MTTAPLRRGFVAAAAAAFLAAACGTPPDPNRPDIVLVVVDTLRADRLGVYGHHSTSPRIDQMAKQGIVFDAAWAAAPWTLPSIMSIVTGRTPSSHKVENDGLRLASDVPTLPRILEERGYATGGFVSHIYVTAPFGFDRGFERFEDFGLTKPGYRPEARLEPNAEKVTGAALDWLDRQGGRPVFMMVHYFDPHWPYEPPEKVRALFPTTYAGPLDAGWDSLSRFQDPAVPLPEDYRAFIEKRYDGEIFFVDQQIARLIDGLEKSGRSKRSWVFVTADHGEEFKDHGSIGHGRQMYEEVVRVPLVVAGPPFVATATSKAGRGSDSARATRIATPVSGIDLLPTLVEIAGASVPAGVEGRSLLPLMRAAAPQLIGSTPPAAGAIPPEIDRIPTGDRPVISETVRLNANRRAVRIGDLKVIHAMDENRSELYDLAADPREAHDVAAARPDERRRLTRILFARPDLLSGGWNVRWRSDGRGHRFDGRITTTGIFRSVVPLFHEGGAYRLERPDTLTFADLDQKGEGGIVFTVAPETATVTFDLRVDRRPRPEWVLVGGDGTPAAQIPLALDGAAGGAAVFAPPPGALAASTRGPAGTGRPGGGGAPPAGYLLWRTRPAAPDQPVTLDEETRARLRALGYID
ncbi:MAG TPA: sulfatase [Candidatus Polarisedimenticolia bacterium]|nr:sulfatase [Candidatus Polarisedimenticolia bacterium]